MSITIQQLRPAITCYAQYARAMHAMDRCGPLYHEVRYPISMTANNGGQRIVYATIRQQKRGRATVALVHRLYRLARIAYPNAVWT